MVAVIANGGKQYIVEVNKVIELERIDLEIGAEMRFDTLLSTQNNLSFTAASSIIVIGIIVRHYRGEKVIAYKKRRRNFHSAKTIGHRQYYTAVLIKSIQNK